MCEPFRVAVVVGHNQSAQGAVAVAPLGLSEFTYYNQVADRMGEMAVGEMAVKKFNRVKTRGYSREIDTVYALVDGYSPDVSIELHFNSASPSATGIETLSSGSTKSKVLAKHVQRTMLDRLGLRDRGVKIKSRQERGGRSLHAGRAPAILVEPFFGSNAKDCEAANTLGIDGMAQMFLDGIQNYMTPEVKES